MQVIAGFGRPIRSGFRWERRERRWPLTHSSGSPPGGVLPPLYRTPPLEAPRTALGCRALRRLGRPAHSTFRLPARVACCRLFAESRSERHERRAIVVQCSRRGWPAHSTFRLPAPGGVLQPHSRIPSAGSAPNGVVQCSRLGWPAHSTFRQPPGWPVAASLPSPLRLERHKQRTILLRTLHSLDSGAGQGDTECDYPPAADAIQPARSTPAGMPDAPPRCCTLNAPTALA